MSKQPIAWVTGASGYWGRKVSMSLLRQGWAVVALCRRKPEDLIAWAAAQDQNLTWLRFDFEQRHGLQDLENLPTPNAFFHCAALFDENIERMLHVNVSQPVQLMEWLLPRLQEKGCGRIGVLLGQNGRLGLPGLGSFSATQGALWTWAEAKSRALKKEKSPITLSLVFPARAPSELQGQLAKRLDKKVKLKPPATADKLVHGVLQGKSRAGRRPLAAGLLTLLS